VSDYRIKISISNGRILRLMSDRGIPSQTELARRAGLGVVAVNAIIKMRALPKLKNGGWRDAVHRIAAVLGVTPEQMFTDTQANGVLEQNDFEADLTEAQMNSLCGPDVATQLEHKDTVARLMEALPDRYRHVITARMADATYADIGTEMGISTGRVQQIEAKGLRIMRGQAQRLHLYRDYYHK
jgi:DNA-directed RNA polymerase specialized sigma subunit